MEDTTQKVKALSNGINLNIKDWSIGKRILTGFILVASLTAVAGVTGIFNIGTIGSALDRIAYDEAPTVDAANEMKIAMALSRNSMGEFEMASSTIAKSDEAALEELIAEYNHQVEVFDGFATAILEGGEYDGVTVVATDNDELRKLVIDADNLHNDFFQPASKAMVDAGHELINQKHDLDTAMGKMEALFDEIEADVDVVEDEIGDMVKTKTNSLSANAKRVLQRDVPLIDAAMELKVALAITRIKLEEIVQMTTVEEIEEIKIEYDEQIVEFDLWAGAILKGANTHDGRVYASTDAKVLEQVRELDADHTEFQVAAAELIEHQIDMIKLAETAGAAMADLDKYGIQVSELLDHVEEASGGEMAIAMVDADSAQTTANATLVLVTIISVILGVGIGLFINRSITNPVNGMIAMLKDINEGDGDLTKRLTVSSEDEIGEMGNLFNNFIGSTQKLIKDISEGSKQVGIVATQMSTASEELAAGSEEQQAQLSEVATTMEEMSAMIVESSKNAGNTQDEATVAGTTANTGRQTVADTVVGFKSVAKTVEQAAVQVRELDKRSEEIGNVIQVIDDIADQTNLLALNANIEAARAGDAGRGFAVVADEVRKLAERTVSATAEISQMIESIQGDIRGAVESMSTIQTQSEEGLNLVDKSDSALEEISGSIDSVVRSIQEIASASNEQSSGVEEISKNIEGVTTVAKESASSAQELASSAEQLSREVDGLNTLVGQFKV